MDFINMFSLKGKNALVTGASYGIGFEIAKALSNAGATIIFNDVIEENIKKGLAAYKENNINAHGYLFDITDEQSVKENIKKIESDVGIIDILVNNAGIIQRKPMLETTAADYRKIIDIDLTGQFIMAKAVLPSMIKKGHGKIINICSMMSELGRETVVGYASAKGGLKMLTKNICSEFGEKNIQCNGIGPGYICLLYTSDAADDRISVLVQATLLHLKQHRYVKFNQMAAAIHLISLLYQKRQLDAGVNQMILLVQLYF